MWISHETGQVGYSLSNMTRRQAQEFMAMAAEHRPGYRYSIGQPETETTSPPASTPAKSNDASPALNQAATLN